MTEQIGLKGVLEGVVKMLEYKQEPATEGEIGILTTRIDCARSILDGVIKELTQPILPPPPASTPQIVDDPEAQQAKDDLTP
jgi:hypothetical protein